MHPNVILLTQKQFLITEVGQRFLFQCQKSSTTIYASDSTSHLIYQPSRVLVIYSSLFAEGIWGLKGQSKNQENKVPTYRPNFSVIFAHLSAAFLSILPHLFMQLGQIFKIPFFENPIERDRQRNDFETRFLRQQKTSSLYDLLSLVLYRHTRTSARIKWGIILHTIERKEKYLPLIQDQYGNHYDLLDYMAAYGADDHKGSIIDLEPFCEMHSKHITLLMAQTTSALLDIDRDPTCNPDNHIFIEYVSSDPPEEIKLRSDEAYYDSFVLLKKFNNARPQPADSPFSTQSNHNYMKDFQFLKRHPKILPQQLQKAPEQRPSHHLYPPSKTGTYCYDEAVYYFKTGKIEGESQLSKSIMKNKRKSIRKAYMLSKKPMSRLSASMLNKYVFDKTGKIVVGTQTIPFASELHDIIQLLHGDNPLCKDHLSLLATMQAIHENKLFWGRAREDVARYMREECAKCRDKRIDQGFPEVKQEAELPEKQIFDWEIRLKERKPAKRPEEQYNEVYLSEGEDQISL